MNTGVTDILTLAVAILTLLTCILTLIKSWLEIANLKKSLKHIQVVANPREMKEALIKPLEGLWRVIGNFDKYQGTNAMHYSSGYAIFSWDDTLNRYNIVYSYSVSQSFKNTNCVTAICHGYALVEKHGLHQNVILKMRIENITFEENLTAPQSKEFTLITSLKAEISKSLRELSFSFKTDITNGTISFSR